MTKGIITESFGEGQYGVTLEYNTGELDREIDALTERLIALTQEILDAKLAVIEKQDAVDAVADQIDDLINSTAFDGAVPDGEADMIALLKQAGAAAAERQAAQFKVDALVAQKLGLSARKTTLQNSKLAVLANSQTESIIYCADYTTSLETGAEIGVALSPGELSSQSPVVFPQQHPDEELQGYSQERDGKLTPPYSMTPEASFYNWAMLPGWQRWLPTFRHGIIESITGSNHTCTVAIVSALSSVDIFPYTKGLPVNLAESTTTRLTSVPIRYMTCDSDAFEVGDLVLVRFKNTDKETPAANWDNPEVVGFVKNPRQCPTVEEPDPGTAVEWIQIQVFDSSALTFTYYKARRNDGDTGWLVEENDISKQGDNIWRNSDDSYVLSTDSTTGTANPGFNYWINSTLQTAPIRVAAAARQSSGLNPVVVVGYRWTALPVGGDLRIFAARIGVGQININGSAYHTFSGTVTNIANVHPRIVVTANADGTSFVIDSGGFDAYMLLSIPVETDTATLSEVSKTTIEECTDNSSCMNSGPSYTYSPDITGTTTQVLNFYPPKSSTLSSISTVRTFEFVGSITASTGTINVDSAGSYTDNYNSFSFTRDGEIDQVAGTQSSTFSGDRVQDVPISFVPMDFALLNVNGRLSALWKGVEIDSNGTETETGGSSGTPYGSTFNCDDVQTCDDREPSLFDLGAPEGFFATKDDDWLFIFRTSGGVQFAKASDGDIDLDDFLPGGYNPSTDQVKAMGLFLGAP